jgi:protein phosphatase
MAIKIIPEAYYRSPKVPALALKEAVEFASGEIHRTAQSNPALRGMGTTCVAMAVLLPEVFVAYVGDSRIYLLRDNTFYQLTEDHTVVFDMVRKGILTRDQARNHEERNVLSLSMGGRPEITASYWENPMIVRDGDRFLLCSDGLHDLVGDSEMQAIVAASPAHTAVPNLIEAARRNGGHDNITAALVHVFAPKVRTEADFKAIREFPIPSE